MDGVFYSASSTTEFHFAQESKRTSSETNFLNQPHASSNKRSTQYSIDPSSKLQSVASTHSRYSIENNQPNLSLNPPHRYTFLSGMEKLKTPVHITNQENLNGVPMQIPNEEKNSVNITTYCNDIRPLISTQRNLTNRSKTPISLHSQGSVTVRGERSQILLNLLSSREIELNGHRNASEQSPVTARQCNSNSERVFQVRTGKIVEKSVENRPLSSLKRSSYSNRNSSTMGWSRSKSGDSPQRSSCMTPSQRLTRMDSLKKIKLGDSPSASSGAKLGISLVKETLDEAIDEKECWRARVEELKKKVKEEKECVERSQENIRHMLSYLGRLTKRNENLDKSTMNTQIQVNRLQEEVDVLQREVYAYVEKIRQMNKQIEAEAQVLKHNKQLTITLKSLIHEHMKERDTLKAQAQTSKHTRNKSSDRYRNTTLTHKNFVTVLEDQFQKYAT